MDVIEVLSIQTIKSLNHQVLLNILWGEINEMSRYSFRERNEIIEFNESSPESFVRRSFVCTLIEKVNLRYYKQKYIHLELGSEKWHKEQEKVSRLSSVGIEAKRRILFYKETLTQCGDDMYVHPGVILYFPRNIIIGKNVYFNRNVFITARSCVKIGNDVLIGPNVVINTGNHIYVSTSIPIHLQGHISEEIIIGDDVWIGANVTILKGVQVGKGSVVAAGSVVVNDIPPFSVVAGVPAKKIKERSGDVL